MNRMSTLSSNAKAFFITFIDVHIIHQIIAMDSLIIKTKDVKDIS
jgi:hypothetical protein